MRILFDQGTPVPLRHALIGHHIQTAHEMGWGDLSNGDLLRRAEDFFDLLITTDQNMRHEQNLTGRTISVMVLTTTNWPRIKRHSSKIVNALDEIRAGLFLIFEVPI